MRRGFDSRYRHMKSVVICGSNKFAKEALAFGERLRKLGIVVFTPHFYSATIGDFDAIREVDKKFVALGLTYDHFQKIRMADTVFIYNQDGYIGNSVTLEIGFAVALGKSLYALEADTKELCQEMLFLEVISSPTELAKRLK